MALTTEQRTQFVAGLSLAIRDVNVALRQRPINNADVRAAFAMCEGVINAFAKPLVAPAPELEHLRQHLAQTNHAILMLIVTYRELAEKQKTFEKDQVANELEAKIAALAAFFRTLPTWLTKHSTTPVLRIDWERASFFAASPVGHQQSLAYILTHLVVPFKANAEAPVEKDWMTGQIQRFGLHLDSVDFKTTKDSAGKPAEHVYTLQFKEGYVRDTTTYSGGGPTSKTAIQLHSTYKPRIKAGDTMPPHYQEWANAAVLAKITLLRAQYLDYSPQQFAKLLSEVKVTNTPDDSRSWVSTLYAKALDEAYQRYFMNSALIETLAATVIPTTGLPPIKEESDEEREEETEIPAPDENATFEGVISARHTRRR